MILMGKIGEIYLLKLLRCETRRAERGRVNKVGEAERMATRMCRRRGSKSVLKLYYLAVKAYRSKRAEKDTQFSSQPA